MKSRLLPTLVVLLAMSWSEVGRACTVCMGGDDTQIGPAMNGAIFLLMGCIGGVLGLLVAFAVTLMKRANASLPPEANFQEF